MKPIAIITDFGLQDWYVASMKAVILSIQPNACFVDISHQIPSGDINAASFVLSQCYTDFPQGTIFLAVIDPGVGTARLPIAIKTHDYLFVGPDNGLFDFLNLQNIPAANIRTIENPHLYSEIHGHTFHGHDIFAPVTAHLSTGISFDTIGPCHSKTSYQKTKNPTFENDTVSTDIAYIDHFGNVITRIRQEDWAKYFPQAKSVTYQQQTLPLAHTFGDVPFGSPLAYFGSGGYLEIALNGKSAATYYNFSPGDTLLLHICSSDLPS